MLAGVLLTFASLLLGVAGLLWWEGTSWGTLIASFLAMWGGLFAAWGLLALRPPRLAACIVAVLLGTASTGFSVLWLVGGWWPWGIGCTVGGAAAIVVGLWRARRLRETHSS
jgi:hypothetical protein